VVEEEMRGCRATDLVVVEKSTGGVDWRARVCGDREEEDRSQRGFNQTGQGNSKLRRSGSAVGLGRTAGMRKSC
jgi:hypothetical protein